MDLPPIGHPDYHPERLNTPNLDIYPDIPGQRFIGTEEAPRITQHLNDSRNFDYSPFNRQAQFIFVDACHHREFVASDSENALSMVSLGGVILWHDYADYAPGVVQALDALSERVRLWHIAGTSFAIHLAI